MLVPVPLLTLGLAFLVPLGFALIAAGAYTNDRAARAAVATLAGLALGILGYAAVGFGLQYGGVGLPHDDPGYAGLIWEWSALGPGWGPGWGMAGISGWGLQGPAATPAARTLALSTLPWLATAITIPLIGLGGRVPRWSLALLGLAAGALIFPLAGNWVWGGGWLANLGANLGFGHGFVDPNGAGLVHLLGAAMTVAVIALFARRRPHTLAPAVLPRAPQPLLTGLGAVLLLAGSLAWSAAIPLLPGGLDPAQVGLNLVLGAAAGAMLALGYTWLVAGRPDPLMGGRGLAAGVIAAGAIAPFAPAWLALAVGAIAGFVTPLAVYFVDRVLRWDESGVLAVHGMGGLLGLVAIGVLADGSAGRGWNGIGESEYLNAPGQGVTGLLAAAGFAPDWPAQLQAQLVGAATLALFGFFAAWLVLVLPALAARWAQPALPAARPAAPAGTAAFAHELIGPADAPESATALPSESSATPQATG
jgi:Amt family ammonium transporter